MTTQRVAKPKLKLVKEAPPPGPVQIDLEEAIAAPSVIKGKDPRAKKLTLDGVMKNFPLAKPRDIQVEALEKTIGHYNHGAQYVVLEAPVGSGKSAMALALTRSMGDRSYMLTLTEQLQNQYVKDFAKHGLETLKGRGKFQCKGPLASDGMTCAEGKHFCKKDKMMCTTCPYIVARNRSLAARHTVANYHSYLYNVGLAQSRGNEDSDSGNPFDEEGSEPGEIRPLLIADESHKIEEFLLDTVGVKVDMTKLSGIEGLPPLPEDERDPEPYFAFVEHALMPRLKIELKRLFDPKAKEELEGLLRKLGFMMACRTREEWIPERERAMDGNGFKPFFVMKPLTVKSFGHWVWGKGQRQLFMSGTILSAWQFTTSIGLDPAAGEHVELPSPFPIENRPIYAGSMDMRRDAREESWPVMVKMVDQLMTAHAKDKGIVLAPSNEMLKVIAKGLSDTNRRRFIIASGETRMQKYNEHLVSKQPTVLAAPGFWEGADLIGDTSRFQIIPAVPRPFWAGQVAARAKGTGGDDWYRWLSYTKLLQGIGRSVRSETDEAVTYIFDREFIREVKRGTKSMIPKWVRDAVQEV